MTRDIITLSQCTLEVCEDNERIRVTLKTSDGRNEQYLGTVYTGSWNGVNPTGYAVVCFPHREIQLKGTHIDAAYALLGLVNS